MKKKLLAIFLTVAMIVSLLPTIALAEDGNIIFNLTPGMEGASFVCRIAGVQIETSAGINTPEQAGHSFNLNDEVVIVVTGKDEETNYSLEKSKRGVEAPSQFIDPTSKAGSVSTFNVTMQEAGNYMFLLTQKMGGGQQGGGEHPGDRSNPQIKSFKLDTIGLKEEYDGYYDNDDKFHYAVDSNKVEMTIEYKIDEKEDFKEVSGTWEEIRSKDTRLPEIVNLQIQGSEFSVLPVSFKSGETVNFEYAVTHTKPQPTDFKTVSAKVEIITGGKSKKEVAKETIDDLLDENKLVLNSVKFTKTEDIQAVLDNCLDNVEEPDGINVVGELVGDKVTLKAETKFGRGQKINQQNVKFELLQKNGIEIDFTGAKSQAAKEYVEALYDDIKQVTTKAEKNYDIYKDGFYVIEDLDLLSLHSFKSYYLNQGNQGMSGQPGMQGQQGMQEQPGMQGQQGMQEQPGMLQQSTPTLPPNAIFFSREFRETKSIGNANIKAYLTQTVDSKGDDALSSDGYIIARLVIEYDGCVYAIKDNVGVATSRVYYVPKDTEDSATAYLAAVTKRIKEYGIDKTFFAEQGTTVTGRQTGKQVIVPINSLNGESKLENAENTYYINDQITHMFIKDETANQTKAGYKGIKAASFDIETNAQVVTDSTAIPLDMNLSVEKLGKGDEEHENNLKAFELKEGITFDYELSSDILGTNITKLEKGKFTVTMPVDKDCYDKFKAGAEVMAYNVEDTKGHPVTDIVKEGDQYLATFETTHFSAYTIAAGAVNPKTGNQDNAMLWIFAALGALLLTSGVLAYRYKKARK